MTESFRVGTRGSPLALAQTEVVLRALRKVHRDAEYEVVPVRTSGDRTMRSAGTLDFTDEIDRALEACEVAFAVHSAKDLPARPVRRVRIGAFPTRGDPRDCVILRRARRLRDLPRGARVGSSSVRRRALLLALRPDLEVVPIRGNIGTRLDQIESRGLDGVVLAAAGMKRLGWTNKIGEFLPASRWLPAPGQGALAVEVRAGDRPMLSHVQPIDHAPTRIAVEAERAVVATLGGDCNLPLGAWGRVAGRELRLCAAWFADDGRMKVEVQRAGPADRGVGLGRSVGTLLRSAAPSTRRESNGRALPG